MKKLLILILLFSCSKEEISSSRLKYEDLTGRWNFEISDVGTTYNASFDILKATTQLSSTNGDIKIGELYTHNVDLSINKVKVKTLSNESTYYPLKRFNKPFNDIILYYNNLDKDRYEILQLDSVTIVSNELIKSNNYTYIKGLNSKRKVDVTINRVK
jgi:hypothetical protein